MVFYRISLGCCVVFFVGKNSNQANAAYQKWTGPKPVSGLCENDKINLSQVIISSILNGGRFVEYNGDNTSGEEIPYADFFRTYRFVEFLNDSKSDMGIYL